MANKIDTHELITPSPRQFAAADNLAIQTGDALALVARIVLVLLLPLTASAGSPNVGYLTSLGLSNPGLWSSVAIAVEVIVGVSVILGVATRYGALLGVLYVIVATALAHRYWQYPQAAQLAQYTNFIKNLSILGGLLLLFVTGAGRFSLDSWLRKR